MEKLKKIYAYEIAVALQQKTSDVSNEEIMSSLPVLHLQSQIHANLTEFFEASSDSTENLNLGMVYSVLRNVMDQIIENMTPEEKTLADSIYESNIKADEK